MTTSYNIWSIVDLDNRDPDTKAPLFWSEQHGWMPLHSESIFVVTSGQRDIRIKRKISLPIGKNVKWIRMYDAITLLRNWLLVKPFG